jgi:hypothetical protein
MASSWNKGTLAEQADSAIDAAVASASRAVQEGKSLFQSVVDEAADKLAQGAEATVGVLSEVSPPSTDPLTAIQDTAQAAGEFVYDLLPEREDVVEDIKTTAQVITEGTQAAAEGAVQKIKQGWNLGTSTPAQLLVTDILKNNLGEPLVAGGFPPAIAIMSVTNKPITEKNFTKEELEHLRELARKYGTGLLQKDQYDDVELRVGGVRGKEGALPTDLTVAEALYNSLGDTTIKKDPETGEYYVEDVYDWNIYTDYTVGGTDPDTGLPRGKVYTTEQFENQLDPMEEIAKTFASDASIFQKVHNLAFIFGSRDYKDESKNTGLKMRISLGKLD